jgi:hypothetical protein
VGGEKLKIKLNSAQLELDLGLSLAKWNKTVPLEPRTRLSVNKKK